MDMRVFQKGGPLWGVYPDHLKEAPMWASQDCGPLMSVWRVCADFSGTIKPGPPHLWTCFTTGLGFRVQGANEVPPSMMSAEQAKFRDLGEGFAFNPAASP